MDSSQTTSEPGGKTPEPGGETPAPRGQKRPNSDEDTYCLADYLPDDWLGQAFGPDSIAHQQVVCPDLQRRSTTIVAQILARDVLNQGLVTLGQTPETSLAGSIGKGVTHEIISKHQAKLLWRLNMDANAAKHGMWFKPMLGEQQGVASSPGSGSGSTGG